jgi:hypothetical protein
LVGAAQDVGGGEEVEKGGEEDVGEEVDEEVREIWAKRRRRR